MAYLLATSCRVDMYSEKLRVIAGQLKLELLFNGVEALTETLYVV